MLCHSHVISFQNDLQFYFFWGGGTNELRNSFSEMKNRADVTCVGVKLELIRKLWNNTSKGCSAG